MISINNSSENSHNEGPAGLQYWRSLEERADTPEFREWLHREFPSGASELDGVNRRHFLKIMAASFGIAGMGLAGCRQPRQHILPYAKQPERIVPGVPLYYSSSMPGARGNTPVIVETHDGRPTKLEGNSSYIPYGGAAGRFTQASILDLYDPDRSPKSITKDGKTLSQGAVFDLFRETYEAYKARGGEGLAFLAEHSSSPTRARLVEQLKQTFPKAIWAEYNPVYRDLEEDVFEKYTGERLRPHYNFREATRILSLEADFLHTDPNFLEYTRSFSKKRKVASAAEASKMNRLYAVESNYTLTGAMADHRLRSAASHISAFTALIAAQVLELTGGSSSLARALRSKSASLKVDNKWVEECAKDLVNERGASLVVAGPQLPGEVHVLTALINAQLGAEGKTVYYRKVTSKSADSIESLASAAGKGAIDTLVILGGNPVYDAPANLDWKALQKKLPKVIRYGYYFDETSALADYHVAASHYLECWGDGRTWDGTVVPVQPMIEPIFSTLRELDVIAHLCGAPQKDSYTLVQETFKGLSQDVTKPEPFDSWLSVGVLEGSAEQETFSGATKPMSFDSWLSVGVLFGSSYSVASLSIQEKDVLRALSAPAFKIPQLSSSQLECRFVPSNHVWDGRYNNNGWLQECPEPMTKLTWDNAIQISPRLAKELQRSTGIAILPDPSFLNEAGQIAPNANKFKRGKEQANIAEITVNGQTVRGPLHVQPGLADYTIVLSLGYGREKTGRVGQGTGFDVYPLRTVADSAYATAATIRVTPELYPLANTQEHWSMEGRAIVREANAEEYASHPDFVNQMGMESHSPPVYGPAQNMPLQQKVTDIPRGNSLYQTPEFKGPQQWGMVIDLNSCTGCNACVVACQSENNIPIVGKDQVLRGREMQWIRLDRYYSGGEGGRGGLPEDPQVSFMGMMCQHCELAPCESVCPVNATVHDDQGLNVMAYNRCVGTRYCANNCPYKVRRFNFFDWNKREIGHFYEGPFGPAGMPELEKLQKNPDVTVRMRGVMEKCTYCVQRIESAKINQLREAKDSGNIKVPDGVIKTACQQTCPADAITFGDLEDSSTEVSQLKESDRNYDVLGYLNTRPRTSYLAKLRNPNPAMPDYASLPLNRKEYEDRYGHGTHSAEEITHS